MLLNSLTMSNFGIFEDKVYLDLKTAGKDKPLVLISGKNGAGKTTILEAMRIALYGSLLFGTKTVTDTYTSYIQLRLNRNALARPESMYFVSLSLTIAEQGFSNEYTITREWRITDTGQIREDINVTRNGLQLGKKRTSDFEDFIKRFLPISVFDMLFLDGEHLNALFEGNKFTFELGKALVPLSGLDVYELLNKDLSLFLKAENSYGTLGEDEQKYQEIDANYRELLAEKELLLTERQRLSDSISMSRQRLSAYELDLRSYGVNEITQRQHEMSQLELRRKELNEEIKVFISDVLPFVIARPILAQTIKQLEREDNQANRQRIKDYVNSPHVRQHISKYINAEEPQDLDLIDSILNALSQLSFMEEEDDMTLIHDLSREQSVSLMNMWSHVDARNFNLPFDEIAATTNNIAVLRKQQSVTEDAEIVDLLNKLKEASAAIAEQEVGLTHLQERLLELEQTLVAVKKELEKAAELVFQSKRDENIFLITHKLKNVLEEFVKEVLSSRSVELGKKTTEHLLDMLQKRNFVSLVRVDPGSLELQMYDHNDRLINPFSLSAGEKQLLVLSALWALLEVSDREIPLVFDTLIGRLDTTHKGKVLSDVLPTISKQVILLATDTEVNEDDYLALKPFLGKIMHLDYVDEVGKTVLREMAINEF